MSQDHTKWEKTELLNLVIKQLGLKFTKTTSLVETERLLQVEKGPYVEQTEYLKGS